MRNRASGEEEKLEAIEIREWLDSLDFVLQSGGPVRAGQLLKELASHARRRGIRLPFTANTPFINTIPADQEAPFPGDLEMERRIKSMVRWNAMAMVVRGNRVDPGIGGHISSFASAATLYEIGFNHFFRTGGDGDERDVVYYQGHAVPGVYARAYLEGRLEQRDLENFRRELKPGGGLSSYPHPWLMPEFWEYPSVSMGLAPIMAIYQARFQRYLRDRGLKDTEGNRVWCFLGDGECDEPESLGSISLAAREQLDNLIFVVNCNLQRLDGPVRGNGKIIQELESVFRGSGWNVIKAVWGGLDPLLARIATGCCQADGRIADGQSEIFLDGAYFREHFWGVDLASRHGPSPVGWLVEEADAGGRPVKVHSNEAAVAQKGMPTVSRTIKTTGRRSGRAKNVTHQQKKLNEDGCAFREYTREQAIGERLHRPAAVVPRSLSHGAMQGAAGSCSGSAPSQPKASGRRPSVDLRRFHRGRKGAWPRRPWFVRMLSKPAWSSEKSSRRYQTRPARSGWTRFRQVGIHSHVGQRSGRWTPFYTRSRQDGRVEGGPDPSRSSSQPAARHPAYIPS